jgi:hypothetical protein
MNTNGALDAMGMKKNKKSSNMLSSQMSNDEDDIEMAKKGLGGDDNKKESNTIMQQINNFSLTPMNDTLAEQTIEDHKYLLELVENKCAIAFFAAVNRNQSLYNALQQYVLTNAAETPDEEHTMDLQG